MEDERQRVHGLAVDEDVQLDEAALLVARQRIVERGVAARAAFQGVEKVVDNLVERQLVMHVHAVGVEVIHAEERAAPLLAQLHDAAHVLLRRVDVGVGHGLIRLGDAGRVGVVGGVVDFDRGAVRQADAVDDARRGHNQVEAVLALQPLLHDLHVQQAQKAAAEPEPQRRRRLRRKGEGRVV